jgi:ssDNA-binding Zn-finger/Zn-ribbon topoisomerase 1
MITLVNFVCPKCKEIAQAKLSEGEPGPGTTVLPRALTPRQAGQLMGTVLRCESCGQRSMVHIDLNIWLVPTDQPETVL